MALGMNYAAKSDVGLVRPGNEDSGYAGPSLLMVADGMGGHAAGELASALAIATVAAVDVAPPDSDDVLTALADTVDSTGDAIATVIAEQPEFTGMGTTITSLYWIGPRYALVHVGDSRAYLLRDGALYQLTHDHTYVQTLIDSGSITREEAAQHPRRSLLTRALDGMNPVEADLSLRDARIGDRYLLCTDGLTGVVHEARIAEILREGEPVGCVTRLVDLAIEGGAPDNVTVVVADIIEMPEPLDGMPEPEPSRVVVGAAAEPRVRAQLPLTRFPDRPLPINGGPPTAPLPAIRLPRRRRRALWAIITTVIVLLALVVSGLLVTRSWVLSKWYVGVNGSPGTGTIAIYQGVPEYDRILGLSMRALAQDSDIVVGSLPIYEQEIVSGGVPATSLIQAQ